MLMLVCETQTDPYTVEIGAGNPNLALVNGVPIYNTHVLYEFYRQYVAS